LPMEIRPHVGAAPTAIATLEARLDIRKPHIIRPRIGADGDEMAAAIV